MQLTWSRGRAIVAAACALAVASVAGAQTKLYRVINLGEVGGPADIGLLGGASGFEYTFGINEYAEMVGGYDDGTDIHAWIYLPNPRFNFLSSQVGVFIDLHDLSDLTSGQSVANDIADSGRVVGTTGLDILDDATAVLWNVQDWTGSPADIDTESLHTVGSGGHPNASCIDHVLYDFSVAMTVNDASTPTIVGFMYVDCAETEKVLYERGFRFELDDDDEKMEPLVPVVNGHSWAFDINSLSTPRAVGYETGPISQSCSTICGTSTNPTVCDKENLNPLRWDGPGFSGALMGTFTGSDEGGAARAVNDDDQAAGFGFETATSEICDLRAVFWDESGSLFNLGQMVLDGEDVVDSRAEGLTGENSYGCINVVGWDVFNTEALIWYGDPDSQQTTGWCVERLDDLIVPCSSEGVDIGLDVLRAFDINSYGHIVALGFNNDESEFVAVGLTCVADLNGDFKVNGDDRTILAASLCGYTGAPSCDDDKLLADLDCDGDVDTDDFAMMTATWSGDDLCTVINICLCSGGSESAQQESGVSFAQAVATLGFWSAEDFVKWCVEADAEEADACCEYIAALMQ